MHTKSVVYQFAYTNVLLSCVVSGSGWVGDDDDGGGAGSGDGACVVCTGSCVNVFAYM